MSNQDALVYVDVKQHWRENRPLTTIPKSSEPAALAVAGLKDEATFRNRLHDELHHMPIRYCPQQLQVESTVPDDVVCGSQVQVHYPSFLLVLEAVFDVLRKRCYLVYC